MNWILCELSICLFIIIILFQAVDESFQSSGLTPSLMFQELQVQELSLLAKPTLSWEDSEQIEETGHVNGSNDGNVSPGSPVLAVTNGVNKVKEDTSTTAGDCEKIQVSHTRADSTSYLLLSLYMGCCL